MDLTEPRPLPSRRGHSPAVRSVLHPGSRPDVRDWIEDVVRCPSCGSSVPVRQGLSASESFDAAVPLSCREVRDLASVAEVMES